MYENLRVDSVQTARSRRLGHTVSVAALLLTEQKHFDAIGGFACEWKSTALRTIAGGVERFADNTGPWATGRVEASLLVQCSAFSYLCFVSPLIIINQWIRD